MTAAKLWAWIASAILVALGTATPVSAQKPPPGYAPISSDLLEKMQGRWVAASNDKSTEIEVRGSQVIFVKIDSNHQSKYTPSVGEHFFTFQASTLSVMIPSRIPNAPPLASMSITGQCLTRNETLWRGSPDNGCNASYTPQGHQSNDPQYKWIEYWKLVVADPTAIGHYIRPEVKAFLMSGGRKPDSINAALNASAGQPAAPPSRATVRYAPLGRSTEPVRPGSSNSPGLPAATIPVPAPAEQEVAEMSARERLNREQSTIATNQLSANIANQKAFEQAQRDREATIARQDAEYKAAVAELEAEKLRRQREHEAAMAKWQADVDACLKGDKSRCAK